MHGALYAGGSLTYFGALSAVGSLIRNGALSWTGSLFPFGALVRLGSLAVFGALTRCGSLISLGSLNPIGSLALLGALNLVGLPSGFVLSLGVAPTLFLIFRACSCECFLSINCAASSICSSTSCPCRGSLRVSSVICFMRSRVGPQGCSSAMMALDVLAHVPTAFAATSYVASTASADSRDVVGADDLLDRRARRYVHLEDIVDTAS